MTDGVLDADWPGVGAVDSCSAPRDDDLRCWTLRLADDATPEALLRGLLDAGAKVASFRPRRPTLEEIFLRAVGS